MDDQMKPGDEVPPGTESSSEDICPDCHGSGDRDGEKCTTCQGKGTVVEAVGGG